MRSLIRHFIATIVCVTIFSLSGTLDSLIGTLQNSSQSNAGASLAIGGMVSFIFALMFSLIVLAPVTSIADYLFTHKWPFPFYIRIPVLIPLLIAYLLPWTLFFGRLFWVLLIAGTLALALPLLIYWAVFRALDGELF